ncbi:MAG: hypothetical protein IJA89_04970 [Clostridia bacterium]|nr:hypothetical protein [Clostridia bacterium]
MKKLFVLLLTGILSFGLFTACGSKEEGPGTSNGGDNPSAENPYEGYERVDPITGGGDYEFDN